MQITGNNPIDGQGLYNKIKEINKNHGAEQQDNANKSDDSRDRITVSGKAKEINEIKSLLSSYPDIRMDRVDALKKSIDAGSYNIDSMAVAKKMLEEI